MSICLASWRPSGLAHASEAEVVIHVPGLEDRCGPYGPPSETDVKIVATAGSGAGIRER